MFLFLSAEEAAGFVCEGEPGSALWLNALPRAGQDALQPYSVSGKEDPP